jgi:hypothetical protein
MKTEILNIRGKNITKLKKIWANESRKLSNAVGTKNMSSNMKNKLIAKRTAYRLIQLESKNHFLHGTRNNKNNWSNNKNWTTNNFSGFKNGVPLVLYYNNGRYLGHVWVNGTKASRSTGHFQSIQKTVNLNNIIRKATPNNKLVNRPAFPRINTGSLLLQAAANHLKKLGYKAMSTQAPIGKMPNKLISLGFKVSNPMWNVYRKNLSP